MRKLFLLLTIILFINCSSDNGSPTPPVPCNGVFVGNVYLATQQEVNDFGAQCYSEITGILTIGEFSFSAISPNNIISLSPLLDLKSVGEIYIGNTQLTSLDGINLDLTSTLEKLHVSFNNDLVSLGNINIPSYIYEVIFEGNNNLTSLVGLEQLNEAYGFYINYSPITSLIGLNNLEKLFALAIHETPLLINFNGLDSLTTITSHMSVTNNHSLINLEGLESLTLLNGSINLTDNNSLQNLSGLNNISTLEKITLYRNSALENLNGLQGLTTISNRFELEYNNSLLNLIGLENLSSVNGKIYISNNDLLSDISQLSSLTIVAGTLGISDNSSLQTLSGLQNLINLNNLNDGSNDISYNASLINLCALQNLFVNGTYVGNVNINYNAYNPTVADIISGNCAQ